MTVMDEFLRRVEEINKALKEGKRVYIGREAVTEVVVVQTDRSVALLLKPSGRIMYLSEFMRTRVRVVDSQQI